MKILEHCVPGMGCLSCALPADCCPSIFTRRISAEEQAMLERSGMQEVWKSIGMLRKSEEAARCT